MYKLALTFLTFFNTCCIYTLYSFHQKNIDQINKNKSNQLKLLKDLENNIVNLDSIDRRFDRINERLEIINEKLQNTNSQIESINNELMKLNKSYSLE